LVIERDIRRALGIEPGWVAVQRLVGDHVEIYFLPPRHRRSLKGALASHTAAQVASGDEWHDAREAAWQEAARKKMSPRGA